MSKYQLQVARTIAHHPNQQFNLAILGLGLAGEAGEAADIIKKHVGHGHPLAQQDLFEELGDVMWYIAAIAESIHVTLDSIADFNIEKLRKRYPEGFSQEASINRVG